VKTIHAGTGKRQSFGILSTIGPPRSRRGFSLLEVILSTAILMGSAIVLGRLAWMGRTQSNRAHSTAQAQQLCEQTLNEIMLGLRPADLVLQEPLLPVGDPANDPRDSKDAFDQSSFENEFEPSVETELTATGLDQNGEPLWLHSIQLEPHNTFDGISVLTVAVMQSPESVAKPARASLIRWVRHTAGSNSDAGSDDGFLAPPFEQLAGGFTP
jgi:type II secretory pathway pseudopilin PulG